MAQQAKGFAAQLSDLSSILKNHMVGEIKPPKVVL